jgi:hypothetical protein
VNLPEPRGPNPVAAAIQELGLCQKQMGYANFAVALAMIALPYRKFLLFIGPPCAKNYVLGSIESLQCCWLALRGPALQRLTLQRPALQGQFAGRYSKVLQNSIDWNNLLGALGV